MQHDAIDSNSTASNFAGISFSSVSSPSNPFSQYKANHLQNGVSAFGQGMPENCLRVASSRGNLKSGKHGCERLLLWMPK